MIPDVKNGNADNLVSEEAHYVSEILKEEQRQKMVADLQELRRIIDAMQDSAIFLVEYCVITIRQDVSRDPYLLTFLNVALKIATDIQEYEHRYTRPDLPL